MAYYELDEKEIAELKADQWQIDIMQKNPEYCGWGIGDDYMKGERDNGGWDSGKVFENWEDFGPWGLDELNELVNFYFRAYRESKPCESCGKEGYNPETKMISDDFYDFDDKGTRWVDNITQDELDFLIKKKRIDKDTTLEEVNRQNSGGFGHDAINRYYLIECRAKRLGVWGMCEYCNGDGYIYTADHAKVMLSLWILHPRKGCSRGIQINEIKENEVEEVFEYLRKGRDRNAKRFAAI